MDRWETGSSTSMRLQYFPGIFGFQKHIWLSRVVSLASVYRQELGMITSSMYSSASSIYEDSCGTHFQGCWSVGSSKQQVEIPWYYTRSTRQTSMQLPTNSGCIHVACNIQHPHLKTKKRLPCTPLPPSLLRPHYFPITIYSVTSPLTCPILYISALSLMSNSL